MIYRLHYNKMEDDFIELKQDAFQEIQLACMSSEFQKISTEPIEVETSEELGGMVFPDFMYDDAVPLFSEPLYQAIKQVPVCNLFSKEVIVNDKLQGISKKYRLGLPPRIAVKDAFGEISSERIGNYQIFKTEDFSNNHIYITEKLKDFLVQLKPIGMEIVEADVL